MQDAIRRYKSDKDYKRREFDLSIEPRWVRSGLTVCTNSLIGLEPSWNLTPELGQEGKHMDLKNARFQLVAAIRYIFMGIFFLALILKESNLAGADFTERHLTTDLIVVYFHNWVLVEAIYWYSRYRKIKGSIEK